MSSVRAPGKYFTLTLCFPVFNRFSSIPANIAAPARDFWEWMIFWEWNETFWGWMIGQNLFIICECNFICRYIFSEFQLIVLHMMGLYLMEG